MILLLTIFNSVVLLFLGLFLYYKSSKIIRVDYDNVIKKTKPKTFKKDGFLNITQAAKLAGKSRTTIHRKINEGSLAVEDGFIKREDLDAIFGQIEKECSRCGQIKSANMFYKNRTRKSGLQSWCKMCLNTYSKNYANKKQKGEK